MRVLRYSFCLATLSLAAAGFASAQAPAPKAPDVQTIGGVTSVVTTVPVDLTSSTSFVPPAPRPMPAPAAQAPKTIAVSAPATPAPFARPVVIPHAPNLADVFGRIPRPEWATGEVVKPAEIVTTGPATFTEPAIRAAAPAPSRALAPRGEKPAEKTTSLPRDPAAPAPAPVPGKVAGKEVPR